MFKSRAFAPIILTAFLSAALCSCSGYGSDYNAEKEYADLFEDKDWYEDDSSSSYEYEKSSSSSYGKSSSSSDNDYSSSDRYSSSDIDYSSSEISIYDSTNSVKTIADLNSCKDGEKKTVLTDTSLYRCVNGKWLKELKSIPECSDKNEYETFYKNAPYVCISGEWREMDSFETQFGVCDKKYVGNKAVNKDSVYYICDTTLTWRKMTFVDYNGRCDSTKYGKIATYAKDTSICRYSQSSRRDQWEALDSLDQDSGLCTKERFNEIIKITETWVTAKFDHYYRCLAYRWNKIDKPEDAFGACNSSIKDTIYSLDNYSYTCRNNEWRAINSNESKYGLCTAKKQDSVITITKTNHIICDKGEWRAANPDEVEGPCTSVNQDVVYTNDTNVYACNSKAWIKLSTPPYNLAYCLNKNEGGKYKVTNPKTYLICHDYTWQVIDSLTYYYGVCNANSLGEKISLNKDSLDYACKLVNGNYTWQQLTVEEQFNLTCTSAVQDSIILSYVCDKGTWRELDNLESALGLCRNKDIGVFGSTPGNYNYICAENGWKYLSTGKVNVSECNSAKEGYITKIIDAEYMCTDGRWRADKEFIKTNCQSPEAGFIFYAYKRFYQCQDDNYTPVMIGGIVSESGPCNEAKQGSVTTYKDTTYVCNNTQWQKGTLSKIFSLSPCKDLTLHNQKYTCSGRKWTPTYGTMTDSRNNKTYKTIKIDNITWMAANLDYETTNSWCPQNSSDQCKSYGRLYTWNNTKNVCPTGWRVPSILDYWKASTHYLRPNIWSIDGWQDYTSADNAVPGLEIPAAGVRYPDGKMDYVHRFGGIWLSDEATTDSAYYDGRSGISVHDDVLYGSTKRFPDLKPEGATSTLAPTASAQLKTFGFSIRCVKED